MDPRLGTAKSGPGETVFAIRFNGKPEHSWNTINLRTRNKNIEQKLCLGNLKQFPLEKPLDKSDDRVPPTYEFTGPDPFLGKN